MLSGDLSTMPLWELMQWAEWSGRSGRLRVERGGVRQWIAIAEREVVAASPPPGLPPGAVRQADEDEVPWLTLPPEDEAIERILDLFLRDGGTFTFEPDEPGDGLRAGGIALEVPVRQVLHEGMRHRDEWPSVDETYPDEAAALCPGEASDDETESVKSALGQVLLQAAGHGLSLGEVRAGLAISRTALLRRVHELVRLGALRVAGADAGADPMEQLTLRATQHAEAGRFEEARHLLETLLAAAPEDARLHGLLEDVIAQHLEHLRTALPQRAILERVTTHPRDEAAGLTATEREVYERVRDGMTVGALLRASPLREIETLRTVEKMLHLELFEIV